MNDTLFDLIAIGGGSGSTRWSTQTARDPGLEAPIPLRSINDRQTRAATPAFATDLGGACQRMVRRNDDPHRLGVERFSLQMRASARPVWSWAEILLVQIAFGLVGARAAADAA